MSKACTRCRDVKPLSDFYANSSKRAGTTAACKQCIRVATKTANAKNPEQARAYQRRYRAANTEKVAAGAKRYREKNREKIAAASAAKYQKNKAAAAVTSRRTRLRINYGITLEDYEGMAAAQGGLCAICSNPPRVDKVLAVDHCHSTGRVRGLLCDPCNMGIGHFRDDPRLLTSAIGYLS